MSHSALAEAHVACSIGRLERCGDPGTTCPVPHNLKGESWTGVGSAASAA
jgi:hypothetical protein